MAHAVRYENRIVDIPPVGEDFGFSTDGSESSLSRHGRYVAFLESVDIENYERDRVFVRDRRTSRTVLVSRASGRAGAAANADSETPVISADGRFVAFASESTNLARRDRDGTKDVFIRDLRRGTTELVSGSGGLGSPSAAGDSQDPSLSDDGRFVAFSSDSSPRSADDPNSRRHVFVRDRRLGRNELISRASGPGGEVANNDSAEEYGDISCCYAASPPSISGDGRFVAFSSRATNLDSPDRDRQSDVFLRDRQNQTTRMVGRGNGTPGSDPVADTRSPSLSADGRRVAFVSRSRLAEGQTAPTLQVWVRDLATGTTVLASRRSGPRGVRASAAAFEPHLSRNGRFVVFSTYAKNLAATSIDVTGHWRDLRTNRHEWVNRGRGRNGRSPVLDAAVIPAPAVSGDGRWVSFASDDEALSEQCKSGAPIYVRDLLGPRAGLPRRRLRICQVRTDERYTPGSEVPNVLVAFNRPVRIRYTVFRRAGRARVPVSSGRVPAEDIDGASAFFNLRTRSALRVGEYVFVARGRDRYGATATGQSRFRVIPERRPGRR